MGANGILDPAATAVGFRVLGPLTAVVADSEPDLGGPRQRGVLAALLAASPAAVPVDRLLADAWPDGNPPSMSTLHHYVSRLRAVLEPGRTAADPPRVLVRRGAGYAVLTEPDAIDAHRFTSLVRRGTDAVEQHPAEAVRLLTAALDLWRGAPYAGVADAAALLPEIARLEDLRLSAGESLLEALLRTGRAAEVVARAREHTARHPLRERGWELLARALHHDGRQSDALAALRTVRRVLAEELGLDPGPGLVAVEADVLAGVVPGPEQRRSAPGRTLPVALTDLVGRDELVEQVTGQLGGARLVTLTGPGGVGKSRVALEVAHRSDARLVELAPLAEESLLVPAVSSALGLGGVADADGLAAVLAGDPAGGGVLVLDNAEHLLRAVAGLVAVLLRRAPRLRVLVTSREVLDVAGESVREVLPLPPAGPAVELFVRRARAVLPDWAPDAAERERIVSICTRLDGLPLAVELAASRMRVLSVEQLDEALGDPFAVLDGEEQRLRRTVAWSYGSLTDPERALFRRLAAFAGDVELDGAVAVAGGGTVATTLGPLTGLVRRSLLGTVGGSAPRRFRMLETVKRFAVDHGGTDLADARLRHRDHVVRRAVAADRAARGPEGRAALARLRRDRPEQRAVLAGLASGPAATALELTAALSWSWYRSGDIAEGTAHLAGALARPSGPDDAPVRARALSGLGSLRYLSGDRAAAAAALRGAVTGARTAADRTTEAYATAWLAHVLSFTAPAAEALATAERGVELAADADERWVSADALMILGMVRRGAGSGGDPRPVLADAVRVAEDVGHTWAAISSTWALMKAAADAGDDAALLAAAAGVQEPLESDGDVTSWLVLVHTVAAALARTGRAPEGATLMGAVAALGAAVGFAPERMDPVDGPREAAAVREALEPGEYARRAAEGAALDRDGVTALVRDLLGR